MSRKAAALTRAAALFALLLSSSAAAAATISGKVFEDVNYGGGAGRSHAASSGVGRTNARVELYDGGGAYVTFTTTDAAGAYSFPGLLTDNYTVRVVNSTVSSSRTGYAAGVLPVQTYRTDASGGAPVAVTDHVGGQNPSVADAGNGAAGCTLNTTTGVFTGGGCSGTAQSVTNVALGADVAGLDFGFNFDTIVNVNDVGQGSLRQFLANAAALGAEGALAQSGSRSNMEAAEPLPLSRESSIFMISDGLAHPGLRAGLADQLTGGVAVIAISSGILPALSGVNAAGTVIDGTTQTINVGDTNPGMAGFAGSVGLGPDAAPATGDEPLLAGVPKPEVQVQGVTSISYGLRLSANDVTLRGSSVYGFSSGGLQANVLVGHESVVLNNTGCVLEQNILGASAGSFTDPGVGVRSGNINVYVRSAQDGRVQQNAFGFVVREHLRVLDGRNWQIADNELRQGGLGGTFGGLTLISNSSGQVSRNLVEDDAAQAVLAVNATIDAQDNTIVGNASEGIAFFQNPGVPGTGQISRNEIIGNGSAGVMLLGQNGTSPATTQVRISRNRFGGNGGIAVDLLPGWSTTGVTPNDGILLGDGSVANSCGVIPSSGNEGLDTPIIDSASLSGGLMTVVGRACPGSEVEVYLAVADGDGSDTSGGIGFGEGVRYLGTTTADGVTGAFVLSDIAGLAAGNEVGALAIDALNNTSEFGANASVTESTAVSLVSFEARAGDGAVELFWETGSERNNAGFHLYRGLTESGPWERITETMIRGLGSTPEGRQYSYLDPGLVNATTYYYRLEDVEISGKVTSHGPVSATPQATAEGGEPEPGSEPGATRAPAPGGEGWVAHGDPADVSLREVARTATSVTFELRTGGFDSLLSEDGTTRIAIPGFMDLTDPGRPMLPTKRLWTPALAGRDVRLAAVQTFDLTSFDGLRLPIAGAPEAVKLSDGTSRASFRAAKAVSLGRGSWPRASAQVLQTAFQREEKKAYLELAPLTLDASSGRLTLARRMLVQVSFDATLEGETGSGSVGRRVAADVSPAVEGDVLARFVTSARGVYTVTFEDALGASFGVIPTAKLRLKHLGQDRSFSVEPRPERFGPGSVLYFLSDGSADAYTNEAVYELTLSAKKTTRRYRVAGDSAADARSLTSGRGVSSLAPVGLTHLRKQDAWEQSSYYGGSYTEATDPWMWDNGLGLGWGAEFESKDYPFTLAAPDTGAADARLVVTLQASNDTPASPDVHVLVSLNGTLVAETHFDGMAPHTVAAAVSASLLLDGTNTLNITVGPDSTEYLGVHLDRFSLEYPRSLVPVNGVLEGVAPVSGAVSVSGFGAGSVLLDLSGDEPRWLRSTAWGGDTLGFYAKAGHHYLAVSSSAVLSPVVRSVAPNSLRDTHNQADWILITPREFLDAAQPLVAHRQGQGLATHAVALEDVYDAFGYGEPSPQAIKDFLSYAFHSWAQPSPGYVFLLGEATYDPKGYLGVKPRSDRLPTQMIPGPFGWTASDLAYAAVNGDDDLPDIAIGRLNVNDVAEVIGAVGKILDFETNPDHDLYGNAVLVADVPDPRAGDFEANAYDIASLMPTRPVQQIFRRVLGDTAGNAAILRALDSGASLVSFVGHGGSRIWAYANFLDADHPADLLAQTRQPLMLTMTCSTGYFLSPTRNSITETFVLAQGKGAIAAFSPTSESYNDAAHLFHSAVVQRLESRAYSRLGDLILDAQVDYANSGAFPELLALYHLFGDPALNITPAP